MHLLKGINPPDYDLLNWASDDAKRLSIWKIENQNITGFPDSTNEWCALNLQDASGTRGIVVAFRFTPGIPSVKYRNYANKAWYSNWNTII